MSRNEPHDAAWLSIAGTRPGTAFRLDGLDAVVFGLGALVTDDSRQQPARRQLRPGHRGGVGQPG